VSDVAGTPRTSPPDLTFDIDLGTPPPGYVWLSEPEPDTRGEGEGPYHPKDRYALFYDLTPGIHVILLPNGSRVWSKVATFYASGLAQFVVQLLNSSIELPDWLKGVPAPMRSDPKETTPDGTLGAPIDSPDPTEGFRPNQPPDDQSSPSPSTS
jgi:hypothetical protein